MVGAQRLICRAEDLPEGGDGFRFEFYGADGRQAAFVLRWQGKVYAWLNQCRHIPVELDWNPGKFLDSSGLYLICATHGALYEPDSGVCVSGPCVGQQLFSLPILESDGGIYLIEP